MGEGLDDITGVVDDLATLLAEAIHGRTLKARRVRRVLLIAVLAARYMATDDGTDELLAEMVLVNDRINAKAREAPAHA